MILKRTLIQISITSVILTFFNLNFSTAQFQIKDSSNFTLVYESLTESDIDYSEYNFVGNYIVRETAGPGIIKFFKEPILQIVDLANWTFYEYYPDSKKIAKGLRPNELGSDPNQVLSQKDSISEEGKFTYFHVKRDFTVDGKPAFYNVLFLKGLELPNKYKIIDELFHGKNTFFPSYHSEIMYHYVVNAHSFDRGEMRLKSISESKYSKEEIQGWISQLK